MGRRQWRSRNWCLLRQIGQLTSTLPDRGQVLRLVLHPKHSIALFHHLAVLSPLLADLQGHTVRELLRLIHNTERLKSIRIAHVDIQDLLCLLWSFFILFQTFEMGGLVEAFASSIC